MGGSDLTAASKEGNTLVIKHGLRHGNALAVLLELIKTLIINPTPSRMNLLPKSTKFELCLLKVLIESWHNVVFFHQTFHSSRIMLYQVSVRLAG